MPPCNQCKHPLSCEDRCAAIEQCSPCLPGSTCKKGSCPAGECANESNGICTVCGEVNVMCECAQKSAHSKSEYKRRVAMGDTNVAPPHGVPGTFICRKPAIGPACETQCEKCAADTLGVEGKTK